MTQETEDQVGMCRAVREQTIREVVEALRDATMMASPSYCEGWRDAADFIERNLGAAS